MVVLVALEDVKPTTGIWTGPAFPFQIGVRGVLGPKSDDEVISTAIQITLKMRKGQWIPDPSAGSFVWDLLFEPLDSITIQLVRYYTFKDLTEQIPQIEVLSVDVEERRDEHLAIVKVAYLRRGDATATPKQTAVVFDRRRAA